jgi:hypothetical protein
VALALAPRALTLALKIQALTLALALNVPGQNLKAKPIPSYRKPTTVQLEKMWMRLTFQMHRASLKCTALLLSDGVLEAGLGLERHRGQIFVALASALASALALDFQVLVLALSLNVPGLGLGLDTIWP